MLRNVDESALVSPGEPAHAGGTLVLNFGEEQGTMVHALLATGVAFDVRETGLRLSPHVYNDSAEMRRVNEALRGTDHG